MRDKFEIQNELCFFNIDKNYYFQKKSNIKSLLKKKKPK